MSKIKDIEETLTLALYALSCAHRIVAAANDDRTSGGKGVLQFVEEAITACQDLLYDEEDDESEVIL